MGMKGTQCGHGQVVGFTAIAYSNDFALMGIENARRQVLIPFDIVSISPTDAASLVKNVDPPLMGGKSVLFAGKRIEHVEAKLFHKPIVYGRIDFHPYLPSLNGAASSFYLDLRGFKQNFCKCSVGAWS